MNHNNYYIAANFNEDGCINLGSDLGITLDGSVEFSIASWICLSDLRYGINLLSCNDFFRLGVDNEKLSIKIEGLPTVSGATDENHIDLSHWHYVSATYDIDFLRLYIDGVCVRTASMSGTGSGKPSEFCIGLNMTGKMRNMCIYNKGLSVDEIKESMFGTIEESLIVADVDFTRNPPMDKRNPKRTIKLEGKVSLIEIYPSLRLSEHAFAMPSNKKGINPGGNHFDAYTVHAVFRINSVRGRQFIFSNSMPEQDSGMALFLEYDLEERKMRVVSLRGSSIEGNSILISKTMISINQWVSVATVYDNENLSIYINGKKDNEAPFGPIIVSSYQGNPIIGGRLRGGELSASDCLQGNISRLEVWNKALSDEEVRQYAEEMPEPDTKSLVCLLDFSVFHVKNEVDYAPLSMSDGAIISEYVRLASNKSRENIIIRNRTRYDIDPILLQEFRDQRLTLHPNDIPFTVSEELLQELTILLPDSDTERIIKRISDQFKSEQKSEVPTFTVTQHQVGREFFIVAHYSKYSYVAYRCGVDEIDECVLYKIRLIFTIIAGIAAILFGIKPILTSKAITFIQNNILNLPQIVTILSAGSAITAVQLFSIGKILVNKGLLKELFKMTLTLNFWNLVQISSSLIMAFLGIGTAAMIGSLSATAVSYIAVFADYIKHCVPFPLVSLYGIKFNHNLSDCKNSALNIRIDEKHEVSIPEWTPAKSDPVAYAIDEIESNRVTIYAKFIIGTILCKTVRIKAESLRGSVLGHVSEFLCPFTFGSSNYIALNVYLQGPSIGIYAAIWDWQYFDEKIQQWRSMGRSNNNVYLVKSKPLSPWYDKSSLHSIYLPSESALKLACTWATGVYTEDDIPRYIAKSLYEDGKFKYKGVTSYAILCPDYSIYFDIYRFLSDYSQCDKVVIQCTDCAAIVCLLSGLLGGKIYCLHFQGKNKSLNTTYIRPIGPNEIWDKRDFNYHVINVRGNPFTYQTQIIDACIKVNGDDNPWPSEMPKPTNCFVPGEPDHTMQYTNQLIPAVVNIPYTDINSYRERFFENDIEKDEVVQLLLNQVHINKEICGLSTMLTNTFYNSTKYDFLEKERSFALKTVALNYTLSVKCLPEFYRLTRNFIKAMEVGECFVVCDRYEARSIQDSKAVFQVFTHIFLNVEAARKGFFDLLCGEEILKGRDEGISDVGEISYGLKDYLCYLRNNVVVRICGVSGVNKNLLESFARQTDKQICDSLM